MGFGGEQACSDLPNLPIEWNPDDHCPSRARKKCPLSAGGAARRRWSKQRSSRAKSGTATTRERQT